MLTKEEFERRYFEASGLCAGAVLDLEQQGYKFTAERCDCGEAGCLEWMMTVTHDGRCQECYGMGRVTRLRELRGEVTGAVMDTALENVMCPKCCTVEEE